MISYTRYMISSTLPHAMMETKTAYVDGDLGEAEVYVDGDLGEA